MHFFRFKIKKAPIQRRSTIVPDLNDPPPVHSRRAYEPSPTIVQPHRKNSIRRLLPFAEKVSKEKNYLNSKE
jgi:hypothetical protein